MRQILFLVLSSVLVFSLAACDDVDEGNADDQTSVEAEAVVDEVDKTDETLEETDDESDATEGAYVSHTKILRWCNMAEVSSTLHA